MYWHPLRAPGRPRRNAVIRRYAAWLRKPLFASATASLILVFVVACGGQQPTTTTPSGQNTAPIKIGISLSFSGDFSADGMAFEQGYQLWADAVNKSGG